MQHYDFCLSTSEIYAVYNVQVLIGENRTYSDAASIRQAISKWSKIKKVLSAKQTGKIWRQKYSRDSEI